MTKGELAGKILKMMGINTRFSDATPEEISDVVGYLDDWMTANHAVGARIGYNSGDGTADPGADAGIPDWSVMGVTNSVALMIAPYFEKQLDAGIARNAALGMQVIQNKTIEIQNVQYPNRMPRGHAQGTVFGTKYYHPRDRIVTHNDYLTDEGDDPVTTS